MEKSPAPATTPSTSESTPAAKPKPFVLGDQTSLMETLKAAKESSSELENQARELFLQWGEKDGPAAVAFAQTVTESLITSSTLQALAGWAKTDFPAAVKWATAYETEGHEKIFYLAQIANVMTPARESQVPTLANAWAALDAAGANQWLLGLPLTPGIKSTLETTISHWVTTDAAAASEFLKAAPKGPSRNAAISAMIKVIAPEDPSAAAAWEKELSAPDGK